MNVRDSESVLDRLSELEAAATAGPWDWRCDTPSMEEARVVVVNGPHTFHRALLDGRRLSNEQADAALIALSRNHLRALLEVARAAEAHVEQRRRHSGISQWPRLLDALSALSTPSEQKEETA